MEFETLANRINTASLEFNASEVHGLLAGLVCAHAPRLDAQWRDALLEDADPNDVLIGEAASAIGVLAQELLDEMQQDAPRVHLLLPGEDQPATERATAISEWCQGFLYGFGLAGKQVESEAAAEVLEDFSEISRLDVTTAEEEDAEEAIAELEEYLWVAASLVYQDVGSQTNHEEISDA
ncbi:MAG: UPF0149 family protein [bacterium]